MVIVMRIGATSADIEHVLARLVEQGCRGELTVGVERTIITVMGPTPPALEEDVRTLPLVDSVVLLSKSYELASRDAKPDSTVVAIGDVVIGGPALTLIVGPGTVESSAQIRELALAVRHVGTMILAGGARHGGHSPYSFRGLGEASLRFLQEAGSEAGMKTVGEVSSTAEVSSVARYVDVLEVGPFDMRNYGLLEAVADTGKPIILRRALAATIDDWLLSAEHILLAGNPCVILCESGIRTYEPSTPTTADISAVPVLKELTHLPIIVDPAHSSGQAALVEPLSVAAIAAGADGLFLDVHPDPQRALTDGPQAITPEQLAKLMRRLAPIAAMAGRSLPGGVH